MTLPPVEILGLIAGVFSSTFSIPQSLRMIRLKDTQAVSYVSYGMLAFGSLLWLGYGIILQAFSIILWNVVALCLSSTVLMVKFMLEREQV